MDEVGIVTGRVELKRIYREQDQQTGDLFQAQEWSAQEDVRARRALRCRGHAPPSTSEAS